MSLMSSDDINDINLRFKTMNRILSENFNKTIAGKESSYDFEIKKQGLYGIEIAASAKSRRQNFLSLRSFLRDDDLAVKIDDISFPKKSGKKGLFDSEASWNGSKLKGLNKTILFLIKLAPGIHHLNFLIEQEPKLESISIYQIQGNEISYLPQDNYPPQGGDRRPWLTIILCNLGLQSLKINATAKEGKKFLFFKRDDSDLKLIINGEIQKNQEPKSHKNWYWCGRTLKGESKTFEKEFIPKPDIHYVELWADRNPEVEEIKIGVGRDEKAKQIKNIPTVDNPKWTGNFRDDTKEMLLARLLFGEARNQPQEAIIWIAGSVVDRTKAVAWPNTIKEVILQSGQYDTFKEKDPNYLKIINPLKGADPSTIRVWQQCYEIAKDIISGQTENPTTATHFHGVGVSKDWFLKNIVPNGKFLRKIGDTYFYSSPN